MLCQEAVKIVSKREALINDIIIVYIGTIVLDVSSSYC